MTTLKAFTDKKLWVGNREMEKMLSICTSMFSVAHNAFDKNSFFFNSLPQNYEF